MLQLWLAIAQRFCSIRNFIARAYVTINYTDGTSKTVYSGMSDVRNIKQIAIKVQELGYPGISNAEEIARIDEYASIPGAVDKL